MAMNTAARTVLVVDDNAGLLQLVCRRLRAMGYADSAAADATEAGRLIEASPPDLALVDFCLPGNGFAAVRKLMTDRGRPIPYVLLAEHGSSERLVDELKGGALDYLMKDESTLDLLPFVVRRAFAQCDSQRKFHDSEFNLRQLRRSYELLLNAVGEGLCGLDLEGRITFVNPAGLRMLGYENDELLGQDLAVLAERPASSSRDMKQKVSVNTTFRCQDQVFWRKDGSSFPIEYTSTPIREGGRQVGSVFVFRDLSKRRELEEQVRQAQKLEAVSRLAGGIAHDFNNLLTVISGYTDLLRRNEALDEKAGRMVSEIRKATGRATALTRQLLAFGQKQSLHPKPIRFDRFAADVKPLLLRALGPMILLDIDVAAGLHEFNADPAQLEHVMVSLAVHAREVMPDGGRFVIHGENVRLTADARDRSPGLQPGEYVCLTVRDSGPAMTEQARSEVFDPSATRLDGRSGLGLGLATVYGIVLQSGGFVEAAAESDGNAFRLYFPARLSGLTPIGIDLSDVAGDEAVLLVERDPAVRELNARVLRGLGYRVLEAAGAEDGQRLYRSAPDDVDALVTDVVVPLNGPAPDGATRSDLPVLWTAADRPASDEAMSANVVRLSRPYSPEQLVRSLRGLLDQAVSALR
jgi:PAS domain S-box-containing protein